MRIGFVISGSHTIAGARLQGYLMHDAFRRMGQESRILFAPSRYVESLTDGERRAIESQLDDLDVLVLQKVFGEQAQSLRYRCRQLGIAVVYIACNFQGRAMVECADYTIAVSSTLKKGFGFRSRDRIQVVEDPVEVADQPGKATYESGGAFAVVYVAGEPMEDPLLARFNGLGERMTLHQITGSRSLNESSDGEALHQQHGARLMRLVRLHPVDVLHKIRTRGLMARERWCWRDAVRSAGAVPSRWHAWGEDTVCDEIVKHDVAVIPCELNSEWNLSKSANRATMFMALGMPVVASPLPAYCEVIEHGRTGFIAETRKDWIECLDALRNKKLRERIGRAAREEALSKYRPEVIAKQYLSVMKKAVMDISV